MWRVAQQEEDLRLFNGYETVALGPGDALTIDNLRP